VTLDKEVKVFRSVDEIGRDAINSISDDAFFSFEWFKTIETQESLRMSPLYIAVYNGGQLAALAPCFIDILDQYFHYARNAFGSLSFVKKMLVFGHRLGFCQEHVLLCYSPFSYRSEVLMGSNSEKKLILSLLAEKIDDFCKKERVLFSSFLFVSQFDKLLMNNLEDFGYLKTQGLTNSYLNIRWSSFKNYLESFNSKLRKNIRREIRKCGENGVTIEESEFEDLAAYVSGLMSNIAMKYNDNAGVNFYSSFFSKLGENAKNRIKLFAAKKNHEVVGFSLFLRQGDILDSCFAGFKYDVLTNTDFVYFNVCYYAPIRWAIEKGVKTIYYRGRGEKLKLHRGCEPENSFCFVKCHDEFLGSFINYALRIPLHFYLWRRSRRTHSWD